MPDSKFSCPRSLRPWKRAIWPSGSRSEGDAVAPGDVIAENREPTRATMEVEAVDEGTLGKIPDCRGYRGPGEGQHAHRASSCREARARPIWTKASSGKGNRRASHPSDEPEEHQRRRRWQGRQAEDEPSADKDAPPRSRPRPRQKWPADPDIPEGTEMVPTTVREALRDCHGRRDPP